MIDSASGTRMYVADTLCICRIYSFVFEYSDENLLQTWPLCIILSLVLDMQCVDSFLPRSFLSASGIMNREECWELAGSQERGVMCLQRVAEHSAWIPSWIVFRVALAFKPRPLLDGVCFVKLLVTVSTFISVWWEQYYNKPYSGYKD